MSMLNQITRGPIARPHYIGLYGPGGVGKSTFAAAAPKPIFIGTDDGTGTMDVARFPVLETWSQAIAAIDTLEKEKHDFETAVIDTVNGLEPLLWSHLCLEARCNSIEEIDGGFGKGYVRATEQWIEYFKRLKRLRNKMNVITLGHAIVKTVEDVIEGERYDRYLLKMHQQAAAAWHESVDCMFFAKFDQSFRKEKGAKKARATGDGKRIMFTEERPGFLAKSRFDLPSEMEKKPPPPRSTQRKTHINYTTIYPSYSRTPQTTLSLSAGSRRGRRSPTSRKPSASPSSTRRRTFAPRL